MRQFPSPALDTGLSKALSVFFCVCALSVYAFCLLSWLYDFHWFTVQISEISLLEPKVAILQVTHHHLNRRFDTVTPLNKGVNELTTPYSSLPTPHSSLLSHHQPDESFRLAEHVGVAHTDGIDLFARDGLSVLAHMELLRVDHLGELLGPHAAVRGDEAIHYGFGKGHGSI